MPQAAPAVSRQTDAKSAKGAAPASRITELKVSGHLMTLETGTFCIMLAGQQSAAHSGLPGARLSPPPGPMGRPDSVAISTFRGDGWLSGGDAGLVRVTNGPAQILVTIYQMPEASPEQAPRLNVMPLTGDRPVGPRAPVARAVAANPQTGPLPEVVAHVQRMGDVAAGVGDWIGTKGSRLWVEGFGLAPRDGIEPGDIEYQAVLGKDWLSPWVEGGKFCGSRGMALPLLGLIVRLKGPAAETHELSYSASFVDGSAVGPVSAGEPCQAESLAALEAFQVELRPRQAERSRPAAPSAPISKPAGRAQRAVPPAKAGKRRA